MTRSKHAGSENAVKNVSRETLDRLTVFHDLLRRWQNKINLIAPSTIDHIWDRHITDSLQSCAQMQNAKSLIDLGSGAGFPGLVQAILMAEQGRGTVDLIETSGKKCAFLREVVRETGIRKAGVEVSVHASRIEDTLPNLAQPEFISARALASLDKLLDFSAFHLCNGSIGIFPKGRDFERELTEARQRWRFDVETTPSVLEEGSLILRISNLQRM